MWLNMAKKKSGNKSSRKSKKIKSKKSSRKISIKKSKAKTRKNKGSKKIKKKKTNAISRSRSKNLSRMIENKLKKIVKTKSTSIKRDKSKPINLNLDKVSVKPDCKLIFDTNFLMIPGEFKIDIFADAKKLIMAKKIDMMIFDKTIYELQKIAETNSKFKTSAKVALDLINVKKLNIIQSKDEKIVDDMLLELDQYFPDFKGKFVVATQDGELKARLKEKKIKVLIMAGKKKLALK